MNFAKFRQFSKKKVLKYNIRYSRFDFGGIIMKTLTKTAIILILTLLLLFAFPATVFAYNYAEPDLSTMVETEKVGKKEIKSISQRNLAQIKNSKAKTMRMKSDTDKLQDVLNSLGFQTNAAQFNHIDETVSLSEISNLKLEASYIKSDSAGNTALIDKTEVAEALYAAQTPQPYAAAPFSTLTHSHNSQEELSSNGYMLQQVLIIYTPHYNGTNSTIGRYVVFGMCLWLTDPIYRANDAISLGSTYLEWNNKWDDNNSNFNLLITFDVETVVSSALLKKEQGGFAYDATDANVSSAKGVYFKFNLPNNTIPIVAGDSTTFSNFGFLISAIGRVHDYDDPTQQLSVDLRYAHLRAALNFTAGLSWSSTAPKVSFTSAFSVQKVYYDHHYSWNYYNDFYA